MNISKTLYDEFRKDWNTGKYAGQRLGQAFYNHFSLHKHDKKGDPFLDRLYNADESQAKAMIATLIDGAQ